MRIGQEYYIVNPFRLLVILFKLILQITKLQVFGMADRSLCKQGMVINKRLQQLDDITKMEDLEEFNSSCCMCV